MSTHDETPPILDPKPTCEHSYSEICQRWADCDHWPLRDAIYLLGTLPPKVLQTHPITPEQQRKNDLTYELAKNDAGKSLATVKYGAPQDDVRVTPTAFLKWTLARGYSIPPELKAAVDEAAKQRPSKRKRKSSVHGEQYLKIATKIWEKDPTITIKAMGAHPDILAYSKEHNLKYIQPTIMKWIKAACPNHSPGRRPKG